MLLLDRVDYTTYINKGMLADMSDTVPLDALQSNIIDPFMTDGRAYVLPARFIVPALCGDAGTLDGLTDLNDLQDAVLAAAPRPDTEQYSDEYYTALPMTRSMLWRWPAALTSRSCSCLPVPMPCCTTAHWMQTP